MFQQKTKLLGVGNTFEKIENINKGMIPEVCFIGRSNVGKSSIINSILYKKHLIVSPKPGETKDLNFWKLGPDNLVIVDMPGCKIYFMLILDGFAYSKEEVVKQWGETSKEYLKNRKQLKMIFLLLDSRHGIKLKDDEMLNYLESCQLKYQIILTKVDLARENKIGDLSKFKYLKYEPLETSSEKGIGIMKLRERIYEYSNFDEMKWRKEVKQNVVYYL